MEVLGALLKDVAGGFPDTTIHIGGDEVNGPCYLQNSNVTEWMERHGMSTVGGNITGLLQYVIYIVYRVITYIYNL